MLISSNETYKGRENKKGHLFQAAFLVYLYNRSIQPVFLFLLSFF